ncbi:Methylthioribose-1-phosphate isomerase (fragment) [Kamptonema sp. PCC 6506]
MTSQSTQVSPVIWKEDRVYLIDQNRLPSEYTVVEISCCEDMAEAIKTMIVRGAPAIGIAAAYGIYLGAREIETTDRDQFLTKLEAIGELLAATRPTAVNLFWAISRMLKTARQTSGSVEQVQQALLEMAKTIHAEDLQTCKDIGDKGLEVLPKTPEKLNSFDSLQCWWFSNCWLWYSFGCSAFRMARWKISKSFC